MWPCNRVFLATLTTGEGDDSLTEPNEALRVGLGTLSETCILPSSLSSLRCSSIPFPLLDRVLLCCENLESGLCIHQVEGFIWEEEKPFLSCVITQKKFRYRLYLKNWLTAVVMDEIECSVVAKANNVIPTVPGSLLPCALTPQQIFLP